MVDLTNMSREELEVVMNTVKEGLTERLDDFDALRSVYEEVYGGDGIPHEIIDYVLNIQKGNITKEQAVSDYRIYLQNKKGLEEKIRDSLGLPEYVKIGDGAEKWVLDYSGIIDDGGRKMVIKYKLEC